MRAQGSARQSRTDTAVAHVIFCPSVAVADFLRRWGRLACLFLSAVLAAGDGAALAAGSDASILARTRVVQVGDGISLHYLERGEGPPVVFVHRASVKALGVPVLLMSGEDSLAMLKQIDGELRRLLPSADVAVIPHASHEMWAERPDDCRARVMAFFAKH